MSLYRKALAAYTAAMASVVAATAATATPGTMAALVMAVRKHCMTNGASVKVFLSAWL